jgi:hypothetical protein
MSCVVQHLEGSDGVGHVLDVHQVVRVDEGSQFAHRFGGDRIGDGRSHRHGFTVREIYRAGRADPGVDRMEETRHHAQGNNAAVGREEAHDLVVGPHQEDGTAVPPVIADRAPRLGAESRGGAREDPDRSVDSMLLPKRPSPCDSTEQKEIHRT